MVKHTCSCKITDDMRLLTEYEKLENSPSFSGMRENTNTFLAVYVYLKVKKDSETVYKIPWINQYYLI